VRALPEPHVLLYLREILQHGRPEGSGQIGIGLFQAAIGLERDAVDTVDTVGLRVAAVVAPLVLDVEIDEQAKRQPDREPDDVDEGIALLREEGAKRDPQVVAEHGVMGRFLEIAGRCGL